MEQIITFPDLLLRFVDFLEDDALGSVLCLHKEVLTYMCANSLRRRQDAKTERILFTVLLEFSIFFQISVPLRRYAQRNEPSIEDVVVLCVAIRQTYHRRCARCYLSCVSDQNWQQHQHSQRVAIVLAEMLSAYRRFCLFHGNGSLSTRVCDMVSSSNITLSEEAVDGVVQELELFPAEDLY